MAYALVIEEGYYFSIAFPIVSSSDLNPADSLKAPQHLRNFSGEFTERKDCRLNQFRIRQKESGVIGMA